MPYIIGAITAGFVIWAVLVQRKLVAMDENINNAMNQIGVQISSRFEALIALLDISKVYAAEDAQTLIDVIKPRRNIITARSTPDDVRKQDEAISEILDRFSLIVRQHPELKADKNYIKYMNAVDSYEKMMCTSCLIYNDSVTKLNRELRMFPVSLLGGMFGFSQRDYMEAKQEKIDVPSAQ